MRALERNKQSFYYRLYTGSDMQHDDDGFETGENSSEYGEPVQLSGNISPARGDISIEQFGNSIQYDKVIVIDDTSCPIDEKAVLLVDHTPAYDGKGQLVIEYDYIVRKVARSLNSVSIAVQKVENSS